MIARHYTNWTDEHANCPESFDWNLLDTKAPTHIAWRIVMAIEKDMTTSERNLVPGLREALEIIAGIDC